MPVHILSVPTAAPWPKATEVIDFTVAVRTPHAFQDHDALINDASIMEGHLDRIANPFGVNFQHLRAGETVDV
jgi:hypothetical protein